MTQTALILMGIAHERGKSIFGVWVSPTRRSNTSGVSLYLYGPGGGGGGGTARIGATVTRPVNGATDTR